MLVARLREEEGEEGWGEERRRRRRIQRRRRLLEKRRRKAERNSQVKETLQNARTPEDSERVLTVPSIEYGGWQPYTQDRGWQP